FDGPIESDAMNATFATVFQVVFGRGVYAGGTLWNLPDGQIVYEGTGAVEITASWSDPRVTGIGFIYRSAESPDYKAGGSLPNGEAFVLPITPMMTDMPHAKVSRWQFGFGPDSSPGAVMGPFNLRVDIVRANDIMVFPAHPDFWQGAHNLTLMDADHSAHVDSYAKRSLQPATQGNFSEDLQKFPKPVPMETKAITFTVNVTSATSTPGEVSHFQLFYHGADSTVLLRCPSKPIASIPGTLTWTVPSTMEMSDSPYSPESQWQFLVEPKVTFGPGLEDVGGMTDVDYSYHVWVMATDLDVSEVEQCSANGG
ncbi:MAG TPA: hypothetical protein VHH36_05510, partial [Candidatus Thermoplasmatota archaeon]|nr:hypothetical protein [Candidatus Thermoplasmatota archaeon]